LRAELNAKRDSTRNKLKVTVSVRILARRRYPDGKDARKQRQHHSRAQHESQRSRHSSFYFYIFHVFASFNEIAPHSVLISEEDQADTFGVRGTLLFCRTPPSLMSNN
jgi:hypothetical protein